MTADAYVYLLSDYDESGSDNVVATLYRANLASLVDINWPDSRFHLPAHGPELRAEAKKKLAAHLEKTDEDLAAGQKWGLQRWLGRHPVACGEADVIMSTAEIDEELRAYADLRGRMRAHAIDMIVRDALTSPLGQAVKFEVRDGVMLSAGWPCRCSSCEARKANVYGFIEAVRGRYRALFESRPAPS